MKLTISLTLGVALVTSARPVTAQEKAILLQPAALTAAQLLPPEIQTIIEVGTALSGMYSGVTTALDTMAKIQGLLDGVRTPTAMEQQFTALNQHLDDIGIDVIDLIGNSFQGLRLTYAKSAYQQQRRAATEGDFAKKMALLNDADNNSLLAVNFAFHESAFQRKLKGKTGLSYDWRVGMPHLLYIIGVRLQVMGTLLEVAGQRFISSTTFDQELLDLRFGLLAQRARIIAGIQMNEAAGWVRDTNTGLEYRRASTSSLTFANIRDALWYTLPLFEIQQVLDTLNLHLEKEPDLTSRGRVVLEADPRFCLQGRTQLVPYSTPTHYVELSPCPMLPPPYRSRLPPMEYDRGTGYLKDLTTGWCVGVDTWHGSPRHLFMWPDCDGRNSFGQIVAFTKWSWDPISKVLMSEHGEMKVMELIGGGTFTGNQLTLWPMNGLGHQRWVPWRP